MTPWRSESANERRNWRERTGRFRSKSAYGARQRTKSRRCSRDWCPHRKTSGAASRATSVCGLLEIRDQQIVVVVEDNGCGFAIDDVSREAVASLGLVSMRERAALVGGELTIESTPGFGTTITARVPITDADGASHGLCDEAAHPHC